MNWLVKFFNGWNRLRGLSVPSASSVEKKPAQFIQRGFAFAALILLAVWPVWRAGYPTIGDGLIHFYRLVQFDALLRQGVWFPRWASDLCYGYGCPVFNFYPPLVYYAGAFFHAFGLTYANSLLMVYTLAFGGAITGAYFLARDLWESDAAGWVAAGAYGFAPYLYFNALARGALPELCGLGLLPWVLWALLPLPEGEGQGEGERWGGNSRGAHIGAPLLFAALLLTHFLSALLAAPLIVLVVSSAPRRSSRFTVYRSLFTPTLLAFALTAFIWLPAIAETGAVHFEQLTGPADLDFHHHFLALRQLFAWPRAFDPQLVFVTVPPSLNLAALALALLALIKPSRSLLTIYGSLFTLLFLTHPISAWLWEQLPFAALIQFPWRLMGPASLLLALLAARALLNLESLNLESWILNLSLPLFFFFSLSWTFAAYVPAPVQASVNDLTAYELSTGQLGTTATGEFLPTAVHELPGPTTERLALLPEGVSLVTQTHTADSSTLMLEARAPTSITFNIFYFLGWAATVDGAPVSITVTVPHGLIRVPVSAGPHTVRVYFGDTPLRVAAKFISLAALLGLIAFAARHRLKPTATPQPARFAGLPLAMMALALLLVRVLWIDGQATPFAHTRFTGEAVTEVTQALDVNFDNQLVLLGVDYSTLTMSADGALPLTLYWRAQNQPAADDSTSLQVFDAAGELFGQSDSQHPGRVPTTRWQLDQYAADEHTLRLLPGTPPGAYTLTVSVYQPGGSGLSVLDANQIPQGQIFVVGALTVTRAAQPPVLDAAEPTQLALGPLTLVGYTLETPTLQVGDEIKAILFWRNDEAITRPLTARLELIQLDGTLITQQAVVYPAAWWPEAHTPVRVPVRFRLPATATEGRALLRAQFFAPDGAAVSNSQPLFEIQVRVPSRSFTVPPIAHPLVAQFGEGIQLLGYDLHADSITLYWQSRTLMDTGYTVFAHALDAEGHLLAQVDSVPVSGVRPTTGWLPGEIITDTYALSLTGAAKIEVGWYDPRTLTRLGTLIIKP